MLRGSRILTWWTPFPQLGQPSDHEYQTPPVNWQLFLGSDDMDVDNEDIFGGHQNPHSPTPSLHSNHPHPPHHHHCHHCHCHCHHHHHHNNNTQPHLDEIRCPALLVAHSQIRDCLPPSLTLRDHSPVTPNSASWVLSLVAVHRFGMLVGANIPMHRGHQMQDNQPTNTVQLGNTIAHSSTLFRMVGHIRHATIAENIRGFTMLIRVQPILMLKYCHNLSNRESYLPTYPFCNLLIHHPHLHKLNLNNLKSIHSLTLLSLQQIVTT